MFNKTLISDTHTKTLAKTILYRVLSFLVTMVLTAVLGGNLNQALAMGGIVLVVGMSHYYLYDRLWQYIAWQRNSQGHDSQIRSIAKSIIYRLTAIVLTALLARMVFADNNLTALLMASFKFVINLMAYFFLERVFNAWQWGREITTNNR